jgi:hypothetical protein
MVIPYFETADRPTSPTPGEMYFDYTDGIAYMWDSTTWRALW